MTPAIDVDFGSLFLSIRNGLNIRQDKSGLGLPITRIETISSGDVDPSRVGFANIDANAEAQWLLQPEDILFSHINSPDRVGHCARYLGTPRMLVHGMNLLCLRPDPAAIDSSYLLRLLRSSGFRAKLEPFINRAVNQASVSIANLRSIRVSIPQLDEQRRIAAILDQADDLRRKRRLAIEKLTALPQAIFQEMFGNPIINPNSFPVKTLKSLGRVMTGRTPPSAVKGMFGGVIPFVTPGDLDNGEPVRRTVTEAGAAVVGTVRRGSVLVCCIGTIGKMDMAKHRCAFNQQINAVEWSPSIDDSFGFYSLKCLQKMFANSGSSTTLPILKKSRFEQMQIPVAPESAQQLFGQRVTQIYRILDMQRNHLAELDTLFKAVSQDAFRLRV